MNLNRNLIIKIIEEPKILIDYIKGHYPRACYDARVASRLNGGKFNTVIDVGAYIGQYSKTYKYLFPKAKIYSFEPTKKNFERLKKIEGINSFNFALGDKTKKGFIKIPEWEGGDGTLIPNEVNKNWKNEETEIKRFDTLGIKIESPCFLKIDVEGYEFNVLKGFGKLLDRIDVIEVEVYFHNKNNSQLFSLLNKHGFKTFIQKDLIKSKGQFNKHGVNVFFKGDLTMQSKEKYVVNELFFIKYKKDGGLY